MWLCISKHWLFFVLFMGYLNGNAQSINRELDWDTAGHVPDPMGYAGAYVGAAEGKVYVMGGANFPSGIPPWKGGQKVWSDRIFVIEEDGSSHAASFRLPRAMGYGAYASYQDHLYIAGGSDQSGHLHEVYYLEVSANMGTFVRLPDLPAKIANCASVRIQNYWYILGGINSPDALTANNNCWRLDLDHPEKGWTVMTAIPGPGRMLAVAGNADEELIVLSGVTLINGKRKYLKDTYLLTADGTWQQLPALSHAVAAAPSPAAFDVKLGQLLIFGGDDGTLAAASPVGHPGFSDRILAYHIRQRTWADAGQLPFCNNSGRAESLEAAVLPPVTTGLVQLDNKIVIPMGEVRPGVRTNRILTARFKP
ncbi:galactose oxidase [Sphingobacterium sp. ML3W]|uniref:galactose oxidase n=1 Tax=Sphingobacterium sp. ML3W TaxID=1538644 RepID=UPI00249B7196|nr:galactose oxidase [Sphingobacterium sp. ML3W]WFA80856.1 galactose oxidase [Sphingobacterium sp. ML3W]